MKGSIDFLIVQRSLINDLESFEKSSDKSGNFAKCQDKEAAQTLQFYLNPPKFFRKFAIH